MDSDYPFLEIQSLEGEKRNYPLNKNQQQHWNIGRLDTNDIVLPSSEKIISRIHCIIKYKDNSWLVEDNESKNGTFVQRNTNERIDLRHHGQLTLQNGDVILIPSKLLPRDEPVFWQMIFQDSDQTRRVPAFQLPYLEYNFNQQQLFRLKGTEVEKISLTAKEQRLIHHMAKRNQENHNQPVVCEFAELIKAIWGENDHDKNEVNHLVHRIRNKIEPDPTQPQFLINEQGRGYILIQGC
ncbi:MAG: FHA domain-containing protein [Gloeotrichia echinulata GP01]